MNNFTWTDYTWTDLVALIFFVVCWIGFDRYSTRKAQVSPSLIGTLRIYRTWWATRLCTRENHAADVAIINNLIRYVFFFATTTVFILAGLVALLGTTDKVVEVVSRLPFSAGFVIWVWEVKVVMLIYIFVYAFFKFTWSAWQFSATSILVGGTPSPDSPEVTRYAEGMCKVVALAGESFNYGIRAYYFSMAALSWFLHPAIFILCSAWVTFVLYRREFHSRTLDALLVGVS